MNAADIKVGQCDALQQIVSRIYARNAPHYVIYGAKRRIMVHFADESLGIECRRQRRALSQLAPLRGEIDGLIDGWRAGSNHSFLGGDYSAKLECKAERYNRRVADALALALEDYLECARTVLCAIRGEIIAERVAKARFEYLIAAFLTALALMFCAWLVTSTYPLLGGNTESRMRAIGFLVIVLALVVAVAVGFGSCRKTPPPKSKTCDGPKNGHQQPSATRANSKACDGPKNGDQPPSAKRWDMVRQCVFPSLVLFAVIAIPISAMLLVPAFLTNAYEPSYKAGFGEAALVWRAAAAGSVGAFFSIALAIRRRTVLPDLLRTSNLMDAALRIAIGFIGGAVLIALLKSHVVKVDLGGYDLAASTGLGVLLIGFVAGFSERLVPDLLDRVNAKPGAPSNPAPLQSGTGVHWKGSEPSEVDNPVEDVAGAGADSGAAADPIPEQAHEDGCVSDFDHDDDEVTPDTELPPASGGVAPSTEEVGG